ncbi:ParA family protein [Lactobacillus taiwanensis]|uniref:ParA family protein n=1 Tax=Lactobacillus taiwanensis TaxID=508451 RepID=UPI001AEBF808|nr:AAA family ATPase [Lactobacillus taiwanensis]QTQ40923.1 AAA family ATPase [Lactobacillus taiwanensis]
MMTTLLFGNMKGGVGKTTNSVMVAYQLAKMGYKTLVCDLDPQANATQLLRRTYGLQHDGEDLKIDKTMMVALSEQDIKSAIVNIMDNLDLLPSSEDFKSYPDFLELTFMPDKEKIAENPSSLQSEMSAVKEQRISYFAKQLEKVKDDYDVVVIDVPPTLSVFTDSAIYATDEVVIVLQTQQRSLDGAETFFEYLQQMYNSYSDVDFDILGVLPVLLKTRSGLDDQILEDAKEDFGEDALFEQIIHHMERLKRYDRTGIADHELTKADIHDRKIHYIYSELTKEIVERLKSKDMLNG